MLVECKLKRQGGSQVELGGVTYHFKDDGTGRHVAMVTNADHLGRFLSITEGYKLADQAAQPAAELVAPPVKAPAVVVVAAQGIATGAGADQQDQAQPAAEPVAPGADDLSEDMDIDKIREIYERELGRKPNPNWKAATLIAGIEGARKATS